MTRSRFLPMCPTVLRALMRDKKLSQVKLALHCKVSDATISLVATRHQYPITAPEKLRAAIESFLQANAVDPATILAALDNNLAAYPGAQTLFETDPPKGQPATVADLVQPFADKPAKSTDPEYKMIPLTRITPVAKSHFKLFTNPFDGDISSREDYYRSPDIMAVREALWDAVGNAKFVALVGESGGGKSTMILDLHERIANESKQIILAAPYVMAMEGRNPKGKQTMTIGQICHALITALEPNASIKNNPNAMYNQLHDMLKAAHRQNIKVALLIEEAHCLPTTQLKQLKRLLEMRDGYTRLLGVVLIAQPEMHAKLSSMNPETREVFQRCEIIDLPPLDDHLQAYIEFKFARINRKAADFLDDTAYAAILARLSVQYQQGRNVLRRSLCFPLAVNNFMTHLLNQAASIKAKIDADVVEAVHI